MKTVAVLGGGPAGASAAERLARAGLNTIVFDEKLAWEKPCGGGITYKAYDQYPYLLDNDTPKKLIRETVVNAPGAGEAKMTLTQPLLIYSRLDLNRMLLERAERAGAAHGTDSRAGNRAAGKGLAAAHAQRHGGSRLPDRGHGRAESAARGRHAVGAPATP